MIIGQPFNAQNAAIENNLDSAPGQAAARGGNPNRTGTGAARTGNAHTAFPHPHPNAIFRHQMADFDIGAFGKHIVMLQNRAVFFQIDAFGIVNKKHGMGVAHTDTNRVR